MPDALPLRVQSALDRWYLHRPRRARPLLNRRVAVFTFDSWTGAPVGAGMRALPSEVHQMLFVAEGLDIELHIAPSAEGFALSGQLFGPGADGRVELAVLDRGGGAPSRRSVTLDTASEFRMEGVSRGTCLVTVYLGGDEIVLPPINVGLQHDAIGP